MPTKVWRLRPPKTRDRPEAYPTFAVAAFCRNARSVPTTAWPFRLPGNNRNRPEAYPTPDTAGGVGNR